MITRSLMHDLARALNRYVEPSRVVTGASFAPSTNGNGDGHARPGDDFNRRADWSAVLAPAGWKCLGRMGDKGIAWQRPGKGGLGLSATTGYCRSDSGNDLLYVFSTNAAPFESGHSYSKFGAYALLYHAGDYRAAYCDLATRGYGSASSPAGRLNLNGKTQAPNGRREQAALEIVRKKMSELRRLPDAEKWLWRGLIPAEAVTILSALPKAGKTTLISHLLKACGEGGQFCGQEVRKAKAVVVTEESETIWAERRDNIGLHDHIEVVLRPFRTKPTFAAWDTFLGLLGASLKYHPADLLIIDTLAKLWPVENENDASEVTGALMPLLEIAYTNRCTLLLIHHLRKSDGMEATATRGSGGITAAVDCILELRRFKPGDRKDCRRVIQCDARFDDRVDELVVELACGGYLVHGDRQESTAKDIIATIRGVLQPHPPGMTTEEIKNNWPEEEKPQRQRLLDALRQGTDQGQWQREGAGTSRSPFTYFRPQN